MGVALLTAGIRLPLMGTPGYVDDQLHFLIWSEMSQSSGIASVYDHRPDSSGKRWCNYPPGYVYVLRGLSDVYHWFSGRPLDKAVVVSFAAGERTADTHWTAAVFKLPAVAADIVLVMLLMILLRRRLGGIDATMVAMLYATMPAVVHNSAVWGQIDAIPTLLVVGSLEMARRRCVLWMLVLAILAVMTKAQAIIFLPIWLVLTLLWAAKQPRRISQAAGVVCTIAVMMLLPVVGALDGVWESFVGAASYYPFTHLNGFSAWFLASPLIEPHLHGNLAEWYTHDSVPGFLGITSRAWGLWAFGCVAASATVVLWRRRCDERSLFWISRLLPLAFFVLSTQMHERYLFPAIAVWAWSAFRSLRWWVCWIVVGLGVSLNVLWAWPGPPDAGWVTASRHLLYRPWLGAAAGTWCSLALVGVLLLAFAGWVDGFSPWRGNHETATIDDNSISTQAAE